MKLPGYYSSGEFAKKAHITKKTIRYYDEHNILKPSYVNENGARFYNDDDFARLHFPAIIAIVISHSRTSNIWDFPWMISRR